MVLPMFFRIVISIIVGITVQALFIKASKKVSVYLHKKNKLRETC